MSKNNISLNLNYSNRLLLIFSKNRDWSIKLLIISMFYAIYSLYTNTQKS